MVAVGSCAISGGVFHGCYGVVGDIDQVIPVDAYIPGCPPRPEAIIDGVVKLLQSLQAKKELPEMSDFSGAGHSTLRNPAQKSDISEGAVQAEK